MSLAAKPSASGARSRHVLVGSRSIDMAEVALTRDKADIALRTLRIVQIALRVREFGAQWHGGVGRPSGETINLVLTRRLWFHCLLENAWLSVNDLERITRRDHRTIEADRDVIAEMVKACPDFRDLVMSCEEAVDACVVLISSGNRLFSVASLAAMEARQIRARARAPKSPRPAPGAYVKGR